MEIIYNNSTLHYELFINNKFFSILKGIYYNDALIEAKTLISSIVLY